MRIIGRFALLGMIIGSTLAVAAQQDAKPTLKAAPPPPGINDPGVTAAPAAAQDAATAPADAAAAADTDPLAPLPKPDTRLVRDKADRDGTAVQKRMAASEHVVKNQDGDTVDEYRENGKVWMIHIVPQNGGPEETFMDTTGTGRLTRDPQQGPVSPVYFSLYDWN
ncbi:MAG TPA: DUF2782 domain-containing protein [Rhodanobacteraceae bacterium]|nr:DUF2782 domain-containing protein [Rhodanobacteraceae bacterium]